MAKRSALTRKPSATPVGKDMVYTGGSKDFDEVTGKYRSSGRATPAPTRLSPGVYRDSQGRLVGQGGRPLQQQPQRPPMQQQPQRPPMQQLPPQLGQQGKGPARDVYTPLPQQQLGLNPQQPDYTGGTGDYNRMPFTLGNEADREISFDMGLEDSTRRSGYLPPDRGMGGDMGYIGMGKQPLNNMGNAAGTGLGNLAGGVGGGLGARLPFGPGMVHPRNRVGPQYDPRSIAFPANDYSNRGNGSMTDDIARRALMLRDQNAANKMRQDLGNFNMQDVVPYNANRRR